MHEVLSYSSPSQPFTKNYHTRNTLSTQLCIFDSLYIRQWACFRERVLVWIMNE